MSAIHRILIVDDDADVHRLLAAALEAPEREIESVYDGIEGLKRVESGSFDLVLTDVNMPGMDGIALLGRIREQAPGTKVVVMTVASTPEYILTAIRQQAFAYFSKPFTLSAVAAMVDWALSASGAADDIEVLSAVPHWLGLSLRCKLETADRILQFLRELSMDLREAEKDSIATAFREILLNAIEHGGGSDPEKRVNITYVRGGRAIVYYVRDPGSGFSMKALPHAAISNPEQSPLEHVAVREQLGIRPGGFGILMTRQLVDELIYNESGNEVMLIKYL